MATKLLGQIVIKLFGPNYLTMGSVRYFFWYTGALKKMLSTEKQISSFKGLIPMYGGDDNAYSVLVATPEGKGHLEDVGIPDRIILKWILKK